MRKNGFILLTSVICSNEIFCLLNFLSLSFLKLQKSEKIVQKTFEEILHERFLTLTLFIKVSERSSENKISYLRNIIIIKTIQ